MTLKKQISEPIGCVNKIMCQANRVNLCFKEPFDVSNKGYTQRLGLSAVLALAFRQPNTLLKIIRNTGDEV